MELELRSSCRGEHYSLVPVCDLPRLWALMGLQPPEPLPRGFLLSLKKKVPTTPVPSSFSLPDETTLDSPPGMVLRADCSEQHYSLLNADRLKIWENIGIERPDPLPRGFVEANL